MIVPEWSFYYVAFLAPTSSVALVGACLSQQTADVPGLFGRAPTVHVVAHAPTTQLVLRCDPRERERLWHFGERARAKASGRVSRLELEHAPPLAADDEGGVPIAVEIRSGDPVNHYAAFAC